MKTRILSGIIMLPLLAVLYFGGYVLMAACLAIGLMGVYEFYRGFHAMDIKPSYGVAVVSALGLYGINIYLQSAGAVHSSGNLYMIWLFLSVLLSLLYLFRIEERRLEDAMATITGIFYVILFSYHVLLVEQSGDASVLLWLVVLSAFGTDIFAYFAGVTLGKHKLCPKISPKKSIEGSVGGIIGSMVLCGGFGYFFAPEYLVHCFIIGALGGVISQFGDLTASIFKRKMGIKDYGNLIPGHGGVLDRFDSVLFTGPLVYYYIQMVILN